MRDQLDPDHWCNGGEYGSSHPDALAMEALDAENKQLSEELEQLRQALHDARIENSGQAAELERLWEARRWIPVNKAHPPANKMVLVHISPNWSEWSDLNISCIDPFGIWRGYQPTHWMPLPEPPKKEVQG